MMCASQYQLGTGVSEGRCEEMAHADTTHCAFNPTVINFAHEGGTCQCAPPAPIPCQRKVASANFELHVLAGGLLQGALQGGQNGEMTAEMSAAQASLVGVIGDPFTHDKDGKAVQFWLPLGKDTHLLTCGNVQLSGHAMPSGVAGDHQQWFDRFAVAVGDAEVLKVEVAQAAPASNATAAALTTMDVTVAGQKMRQAAAVVQDGYQVTLTQDRARPIGQGFSETAKLVAGGMEMDFTTATAAKFQSETMQVAHTHLDLAFPLLDAKKCTQGVLAEIWGTAPMSKETTAMMQSPQ
jgi:hypothetical protein